MAIYIPGWAEGLLQSGDIRRLGSALGEKIAPDRFAQQRLQDLINKNPMLLSQIENMTPEARMTMEQTLGFKNKTPLQQLPVGPELQFKNKQAEFLGKATPQQLELMTASSLGTKTQQQLTREEQKFQQEMQSGDLTLKVLTGQVDQLNRTEDAIKKGLTAYPDLKGLDVNKIANQAVRGGPVDPNVVTAIQQNPGAAELYKTATMVALKKYENELSLKLTRSKDPNTGTILLRTLAEIGNQLNDSESRAMQEMIAIQKGLESDYSYVLSSPAEQAKKKNELLGPIQTRIDGLRRASDENLQRSQKLATDLGFPATTPPPPNETPEERARRLRGLIGGGVATPQVPPPMMQQPGFNLLQGLGRRQ